MMRAKETRRAQSLLDFIMVFAALLTLTVGLVRIWVWFNANMAKQAVYYQDTRLEAIKPGSSNYKKLVFNKDEMRLPLTKDWVFKGIPSGTVEYSEISGLEEPGEMDLTAEGGGACGNEKLCDNATKQAAQMRRNARNMDKQAKKMQRFISTGDRWWKPHYVVFKILNIDVEAMQDSIKDLKKGAKDLRVQAQDVIDKGCKPCAPPEQ